MVEMYGSVSPDGKNPGDVGTGWFGLTAWAGSVLMGGYGDYGRVDGQFVLKIPEGFSREIAALMMCAGITTGTKRSGAGQGVWDRGCRWFGGRRWFGVRVPSQIYRLPS